MFKWLENLVIRRIVKRIKNELPEIKQHALEMLLLRKEYIIEEAKKAIKEKLLELVEKL